MDLATVSISYGFGAKGVDASDHEITRITSYSKTAICDQEFIFDLTITEDMKKRQRKGQLCGVWATQTTGKGIAVGYFKISAPEAIKGEVRVFRSYSCRSGSRGYIASWYIDRYYDGILTDRYCFGDGYARPLCRIMDEYTGEYARKFKYIRQSLYDSRATDPEEKEWMDTHLIVVPAAWTPMDGPPDPCSAVTCPDFVCDGYDKHESICVEGHCEQGNLIEANAVQCGFVCAEGEKRSLTTCWDGSVIYAEVCRNNTWVPTGETCPGYVPVCTPQLLGDVNGDGVVNQADADLLLNWVSFVHERNTTYKLACPENADVTGDGRVNIGDAILLQNHVNFPNDPAYAFKEPAPVDPCAGVTCENVCIGVNLYSQKCVNGVCVTDQLIESNSSQCGYIPPEPEPEYLCEVGAKRSPHTCHDGSQIYTEICETDELGGTSWVPTGETCPPMAVKRSMELAIPKIMYEGQPIDIVLQSYYGATPSSGEPATLTVDGATVRTINTTAGTVKFRWTATGVGMRRVCVNIPANPVCEVPGSACQTVMVSAYVSGLAEQIKREKEAYDVELARLRKLRDVERARLMRVGIPGMVSIPPSLAGAIVEIGGVPITVPTEGISVRVPSGESIITIIEEGIRKQVPVLVSPGEMIPLPPLPGGL
jgi:hypothetical protein